MLYDVEQPVAWLIGRAPPPIENETPHLFFTSLYPEDGVCVCVLKVILKGRVVGKSMSRDCRAGGGGPPPASLPPPPALIPPSPWTPPAPPPQPLREPGVGAEAGS